MSALSQNCVNGWHDDGGNTWAQHASISLTTGYARKGRMQFAPLSGGQTITLLSFKFYKTNTGGGGYLRFYVTADASLLPSQFESAQYLGQMPIFGSGTGWKTLVVPSEMFAGLGQFTGTWYLIISCSVSVTFTSYSSTNAANFFGEYADGSMYYSDGGVMKLGAPWVSDGGVMKQGTAWVSDGGVMKQGIA